MPCFKKLSMRGCKPFFASNFKGYCLLLGYVASVLRLILNCWAFVALLRIPLSHTDAFTAYRIWLGIELCSSVWSVLVRVNIRGCMGPPNCSMALRELRRSLPISGLGHSGTTKKACKINHCSKLASESPVK